MPVFFRTGDIFDFHRNDNHVRFVSRTKLTKLSKAGGLAIGLKAIKCSLKLD